MESYANSISWDPEDIEDSRRACQMLLYYNVDENIIRKLNFGSLDVEKTIREYTEAELGILEPQY